MTLRFADSITFALRLATAATLLGIGALGGFGILASVWAVADTYFEFGTFPEDTYLLVLYQPFLFPYAAAWGGGGVYVLTEGRFVSTVRAYVCLGLLASFALAIPVGWGLLAFLDSRTT